MTIELPAQYAALAMHPATPLFICSCLLLSICREVELVAVKVLLVVLASNPLTMFHAQNHSLVCREGCVAEVELVAEEVSLVVLPAGFDADGRQPLPKLMSEEQYQVRWARVKAGCRSFVCCKCGPGMYLRVWGT